MGSGSGDAARGERNVSTLDSGHDARPVAPLRAAGNGFASDDLRSVNGRLARSRERVRRFLSEEQPSRSPAGAAAPHSAPRSDHPVLSVAQLAARRALEAVADRHPLPLVGTAMAAGGLLFWARPWRSLLRPALIAGIAAARLIGRVPATKALAFVTAMLGHRNSRTSARG